MKWHPNPTIENVLSCEAGLVTATVRLNRCKHLSPKRREMFTSATQSRPMAFQLFFFCHQLPLPTLNSLFIEKFPSCSAFILIKFYLASWKKANTLTSWNTSHFSCKCFVINEKLYSSQFNITHAGWILWAITLFPWQQHVCPSFSELWEATKLGLLRKAKGNLVN